MNTRSTADFDSVERVRTAVRELRTALGEAIVRDSPQDIERALKDQSWLSPVLQQALAKRQDEDGAALGVQAVVLPTTEAQVREIASIAARHRVPLTLRAAGTSNFGLVTPTEGGVVINLRGLSGPVQADSTSVRALAGTIQGELDDAALNVGRELPLLTTTHAVATAGGWVAGGHVGLGSSEHGSIWDNTILQARVVTIEETPRTLTLDGSAADPLLHTFGAIGLITELTMRTVPAQDWLEVVGFFPDFEHACAFTTEVSLDPELHHRVVAAQEEALMPGLQALASIARPGSGVLAIIASEQFGRLAALAAAHRGDLVEWQKWRRRGGIKPSIATLVYGHRMLWIKRFLPEAAFVHVYLDPLDPQRGLRLLKKRYADKALIELKYVRSPWMLRALGHATAQGSGVQAVPTALVALPDGSTPGRVDEVLAFLRSEGLLYQNSHTQFIEDNGLFADTAPLVELKAQADPHDLLGRGRLRSARRIP